MTDAMMAAYGVAECDCYRCVHDVISQRPWPDSLMYPMVVCETCGNKRCPHAEWHGNACTDSNAPGQAGSVRYPA